MDTDLVLVLGLVVAGFSIPSAVSALTDGRSPRAPMLTILLAGALVIYALAARPGGYSLAEVPEVFARVVARVLP